MTNEILFDNDEVPEGNEAIMEAYDNLVYEIYATFYQHAKEATAFEAGNNLDEKWQNYNKARNE